VEDELFGARIKTPNSFAFAARNDESQDEFAPEKAFEFLV
jgi:hypothetical protein